RGGGPRPAAAGRGPPAPARRPRAAGRPGRRARALMASSRTQLTELGTAVGLVLEPSARWPDALDELDVPGIERSVWHPAVAEAAATPGADRDLLLRAVDNGRTFRNLVLEGR